ncbi:hypothetical protein [Spirosoma litoris]
MLVNNILSIPVVLSKKETQPVLHKLVLQPAIFIYDLPLILWLSGPLVFALIKSTLGFSGNVNRLMTGINHEDWTHDLKRGTYSL